MVQKCALCGSTKSKEYFGINKSKKNVVCVECFSKLDKEHGELARGVKEAKKQVAVLGAAAQKGVKTFKEELNKNKLSKKNAKSLEKELSKQEKSVNKGLRELKRQLNKRK